MNRALYLIFILVFGCSLSSYCQSGLSKYVNPMIGTGGHGHTFPGATVPFGMVQLSPDTRIDGSWDGCSGYHYSDSVIYGFSHTHLSGTGCSDYGDVMLMPMSGAFSFDPKTYGSRFSHRDEKATAGYYSVHLADDDIDASFTATQRTGFHKYTFRQPGISNIILDLTHRDKLIDGEIKIINDRTLNVYRRSDAWARDQRVYAVIVFSKSFKSKEVRNNSKAAFAFEMKAGETLLVKVALSAVDYDGALKNMKSELDHWDFDRTKNEAAAAWDKELSKIEVESGDADRLTVFYTALYHCMIQPNIYNDADGRYRGRDLQVHTVNGHDYYTVFSLWDTFRAWHPLMTIIDRKRTADFIKTFLLQYEQGGLLPVWELSSNETECMIGYHSASVIADAIMKNITGFDYEKAFEAMKKSAESRGRFGLGAYMDKGFLESDDEHESVSKTLEYAYDDWCIAQVAQKLGHREDFNRYMERSQSWKNLFDRKSRFIRPRKNGGWLEPFDPFEVNNNYTEANAWQYHFFVPQDVFGLIEKTGGVKNFEMMLDSLFSASSKTAGREQPDITGLIGQYAHGNEPSHHIAYLYNYIAQPWKTQRLVHRIMTDFYKNAPDGLIGNEDCGQMSAWYVLSALGLYPVCPGSNEFAIGAPLFPKAVVHLEDGKRFMTDALNVSDQNFYVVNELALEGFVNYDRIMEGSGLLFRMGSEPLAPGFDLTMPTAGSDDYITAPLIHAASVSFRDKLRISIESDPGLKIFYMVQGPFERPEKKLYDSPFDLDTTCIIHAYAENKNGRQSANSTARFYKIPHPDWKLQVKSGFDPQYPAGGTDALIDGIRGETNWRKGNWQGYHDQDFECTVDLAAEQEINHVSIGFLQDMRAWILFPVKVEVETSADGKNFTPVAVINNTVAASDEKVQVKNFEADFKPQRARFVTIKAKNFGLLPSWHPGYEYKGKAWLFADEIELINKH